MSRQGPNIQESLKLLGNKSKTDGIWVELWKIYYVNFPSFIQNTITIWHITPEFLGTTATSWFKFRNSRPLFSILGPWRTIEHLWEKPLPRGMFKPPISSLFKPPLGERQWGSVRRHQRTLAGYRTFMRETANWQAVSEYKKYADLPRYCGLYQPKLRIHALLDRNMKLSILVIIRLTGSTDAINPKSEE